MPIERTMGPIPERQIDQLIARDSELTWARILNKPTTFPPETHTHADLASTNHTHTSFNGLDIFQISGNFSNNDIANQSLSGSPLEISSDKNPQSPAYMAFHRPGIVASFFGLDTDNIFAFGGWSYTGRYAPIKCSTIFSIATNNNDSSIRIHNTSKVNTERDRWIIYNSKGGVAGYPTNGGLHFYSYSQSGLIENPFSILDDGTVVINTKLRFSDGSEQIRSTPSLEGWILPTLPTLNRIFDQYSASSFYQQHYYRKNNITNSIDFIGNLQNILSVSTMSDHYAYQLPVGFRPTKNRYFPIRVNKVITGVVMIMPTGEVYLNPNSNFSSSVPWSMEFSMPLI